MKEAIYLLLLLTQFVLGFVRMGIWLYALYLSLPIIGNMVAGGKTKNGEFDERYIQLGKVFLAHINIEGGLILSAELLKVLN